MKSLFVQVITSDMLKFLMEEIQPRCALGLVGGSDESKIAEQMGGQEGTHMIG